MADVIIRDGVIIGRPGRDGAVGPPGPQGPPGAAGTGGGEVTQQNLTDAIATRLATTLKGVANGLAELDALGKIPAAQLTFSAQEWQGAWNAATNTPTLIDGTGNLGDTYRVATLGTRNLGSGSKSWEVGDLVIYNGAIWEQIGGTGVSSGELTTALDTQRDDLTNQHGIADFAKVGSFRGFWNAQGNSPVLANVDANAHNGDWYYCFSGNTAGNTTLGWFWQYGDIAVFDDVSTNSWLRIPAGAGYFLNQLGNAPGDLIGFSANDVPVRIPAGTEGKIPVRRAAADATGGIAWETPAAGGGGGALAAINSFTADHKLAAADELGAVIQTMATPGAILVAPQSDTAIAAGKPIRLIRGGAGGMTVRTAYREMVLADTPSLYWRFGEAAGAVTAVNETGDVSKDGTYSGPTLGAAGALAASTNTAADFNGVSNTVLSSANMFSNAAIRTYEGWAWRDTHGSYDSLFGSSGPTNFTTLYLDIDAAPSGVRFDPDLSQGGDVVWADAWPGDAQWVHWVLVFNPTAGTLNGYAADTASLYINGALVSTQACSLDHGATPGTFQVGAYNSGSNQGFDGKIDEIAVYTTGLSAARIAAHYDAGKLIINSPDGAKSIVKQYNQVEIFRETADKWWLEGALG